jgi:transcriptional regulator with GAF, ATPase, and Fis domain
VRRRRYNVAVTVVPTPRAVAPSADTLDFEHLISHTSALLASPAQVEPAVGEALEWIRRFFRAEGCGVLTVSDDGQVLRVLQASCAPGPSPPAGDIDIGRRFPWARRTLLVERLPVVVDRTADLPPEASVDRANWADLAAPSILAVPLCLGETVTHVMALSALSGQGDWPLECASRLRILGEIVVSAVQRQHALEALRVSQERLDRAERRVSEALEEIKRLRGVPDRENLHARREVVSASGGKIVVGRSPAIRQALALAEQVAATSSTVLLLGMTGTGKERFASFIHLASERHGRPMVHVNCSAIPSSLIESELFGRERGAYTGAMSKQVGRFEMAQGSTLFLDEVGELPLDVQVKLLRVLQERTIERLGSPRSIPVDVRIIAATNRDLQQAVNEGRFRSDLYYRLNVFPIVVPPLRDRREDIPALVTALVDEIGAAMGKRFETVAKSSLERLQQHDWPGNVRELRNVIERAMILLPGPVLHVDLAPSHPSGSSGPRPHGAQSDLLEDVEREHILRVLRQVGWRIKGPDSASVRLGMKPSTLHSRMKKLGIVRPD